MVAFVDADLREFSPHFVTGLLGPLLTDPSVEFVKGFYHRPLVGTAERGDRRRRPGHRADAPGRCSTCSGRSWPASSSRWPASTRAAATTLEQIPFVSGYGVEIAMLIDLLDLVGLDALAQVDLGERLHRHQDTEALGRMSAQIMVTAWSRLHRRGLVHRPAAAGDAAHPVPARRRRTRCRTWTGRSWSPTSASTSGRRWPPCRPGARRRRPAVTA